MIQILQIDVPSWRVIHRESTHPFASPIGLTTQDRGLVVAFVGSDHVLTASAAISIEHPMGLADLGENWLAVSSPATGRITVVAPDGDLFAHTVRPYDRPRTKKEALIQSGERVFYQATRSGVSCQSCHTHADSDYAHHDIGHGTGSRPTLSVRGVGSTAPYLRGASYPSLQALEAFTTTVLGGYEKYQPNRAEALAAYVGSLPAPTPQKADIEGLRKGVDAFVKARCNFCHTFPAFTNLAQFPEGFLFPERSDELHYLDVPSLIGVAGSAPYLYNGRADTLEAVLVAHNRSGPSRQSQSIECSGAA